MQAPGDEDVAIAMGTAKVVARPNATTMARSFLCIRTIEDRTTYTVDAELVRM